MTGYINYILIVSVPWLVVCESVCGGNTSATSACKFKLQSLEIFLHAAWNLLSTNIVPVKLDHLNAQDWHQFNQSSSLLCFLAGLAIPCHLLILCCLLALPQILFQSVVIRHFPWAWKTTKLKVTHLMVSTLYKILKYPLEEGLDPWCPRWVCWRQGILNLSLPQWLFKYLIQNGNALKRLRETHPRTRRSLGSSPRVGDWTWIFHIPSSNHWNIGYKTTTLLFCVD